MQILISKNAQKQFNRLTRLEQIKITRKLKALQKEPYLGKKLEGEFENFRSLRAWPYRIIYYIVDHKFIKIASILHRQGAYKQSLKAPL